MLIYNITLNIDDPVHDAWLQWMQDTCIPGLLATATFHSAKLCKVLVQEDMGGTTYSLQLSAPNRETLERYFRDHADGVDWNHGGRFSGQFVSFATELEVISNHDARVSHPQWLFTYGTLQDHEVQKEWLHRTLIGKGDTLPGYILIPDKMMGQYPVVEAHPEKDMQVMGTVYPVTDLDLERTDAYETEAYKRIQVTLLSGKKAWVYVERHLG